MEEQGYTYRIQWLVLGASILLLLGLAAAWIRGNPGKEWRKSQKEYADIIQDLDPESEPERGIFQVDLPLFDRTDRCITCHNGIENPVMKGQKQPHSMHSGNFLADHDPSDFGCTICHGGQGMALNKEDAFGQTAVSHWPYPLLEQPFIQSSCGQCHLTIFSESEYDASLAGDMAIFLEGQQIFSREGCLGCHRARGVGGILGPDLTRQGEKSHHEYSFQHVEGEQSVSNWLKEHFKDPEMVSPGSVMLRIDLEEEQLDALATFVMGMSKPDIPFDYFTLETLNEFKGQRDSIGGNTAFGYFCAACHGKEGEGKNYKDYTTGVPSVGNPDFLRVASPEFIRFTLERGRSRRQMSSWNQSISGVTGGELDGLTAYMDGLDGDVKLPSPPGDVESGERLFRKHCATCHGEDGMGGVAVALSQKDFLSAATDGYILKTLVLGRRNTAMPSWPGLQTEEIADLVAAIRSWQETRTRINRVTMPPADLQEGELRYHFLCSRCHGDFGEGDTGPAIINRDFLEAADDDFVYQTIALGRAHTAMFGWSSDVFRSDRLKEQDISNIIGYMRQEALEDPAYLYPGSNPGDRENGADLFSKHCAECHGLQGEGIEAPALNNQEFLSAATNGFLMATITIGRTGTNMPAWGYGQDQYPILSAQERHDLVATVRQWQRIRIKY